MNDIAAQRRGWYSGKKLVLWTSIVAVELVLVGCWVGFYVAVVIAGSVAFIAVMRRMLGLWAAYLTAIPIGAVSFLCAISTVGGPPRDLYQSLEEVALCLAFAAVFAGPVALGITCLMQFLVDLLAALPQRAMSASNNVVDGPPA